MQMSDYELVAQIKSSEGEKQKNLLGILWLRYENQVHKHWAILRRQMNNSSLIVEAHDDFYSEAYIAFHKAVQAIDLKKVKDDKWRFVGYFKYYLTNLRTDTINQLLKQASREKAFYVETEDGDVPRIDLQPADPYDLLASSPEVILEHSLREVKVQEAIASCMARWDDRRREIFNLRQQGFAKGVVAEKLGVHPATVTYYLQVMKKDLEKELSL